MNEDILMWLINWFEEKSGVNKSEIKEKMQENYFTNNWIDSFGFISFISDIEQSFGIEFSNEEFQDRKFATIIGLQRIIEGKIR